jgi:hypothetical protein
MAEIEKLCIDWRARLKPKTHRLSQIHGDFHPGNIWFKEGSHRQHSEKSLNSQLSTLNTEGQWDFILLDRSRGPWGEPADDVTAMAINYIFFSLKSHGDVRGACLEGVNLFFDEYLKASGDAEMMEVVAPFFAFRAAVVANPVFYPELSGEARRKIFNFTKNVLTSDLFEVGKVNKYISKE